MLKMNSSILVGALVLAAAAGAGWLYRSQLQDLYQKHFGAEMVLILVETVPDNAQVLVDGSLIDGKSIQLPKARTEHSVQVVAPGYQSQTFTVTADAVQTRRVVLLKEGEKPPGAQGADAAQSSCPDGMRHVPAWDRGTAFCIDAYEYPGQGKVPLYGLDHKKAEQICFDLSKRLCTVREWMQACGDRYPYGAEYAAGKCNTEAGAVKPAGAMPECKSKYGVYDMSGNVSEWVRAGVMMGGDFELQEGYTSCQATANRRRPLAGVRCCADPPPM